MINSPSRQAFHNAFRIERFQNGFRDKSVGTGFLFAFSAPPFGEIICLVSAAHVLKGYTSASIHMPGWGIDGTPDVSSAFKIEFIQEEIIYHPNAEIDLCVIPIGKYINDRIKENKRPFTQVWQEQALPNLSFLSQLRWIEELFIIGCPAGVFDDVNLLPVARRVTTATPLHINYKGRPEFLIDGHIYKGSSGSPVVLINEGLVLEPGGKSTIGATRTGLFGVLIEVILDNVHTEIGLGRCLKSELLMDFRPLVHARALASIS